jgi:hypothetical protein
MITASEGDDSPCIKLFNSGATRYISPYKGNFTSYSPLMPPVFLNTANQQWFPAVSIGMLAIQVPNGRGETRDLHRWPWGFFGPPMPVSKKNHTQMLRCGKFTGTEKGFTWVPMFPRVS